MLKIKLYVGLFFFFLLSSETFSFIFSPPIVDLTLPAGRNTEFKLTVINESEETMSFRLYTTDIKKTRKGDLEFPDAGTVKYSCANNISLAEKYLEVPPRDKKEIVAKISLPFNATGGLYGVVMCEEASSFEKQEGILIAPRWRIGSVVRIIVSGRNKKVVKIGKIIHHYPSKKEGRKFDITIRNRGNIHLHEGIGYLAIMDTNKRVVERCPLIIKNMIFPESELDIPVISTRQYPQGEYTSVAMLDFQGIRAVSEKTSFYVKSSKTFNNEIDNSLKLAIKPESVNQEIPAGGFRAVAIRVNNEEEVPFKMKLDFKDVAYNKKGKSELLQIGETPYTLKDIVTVEPKEFGVDPGKGKHFKLIFRVPKEKVGGLYGKLILNANSIDQGFVLSGKKEIDLGITISKTIILKAKINTVNIKRLKKNITICAEVINEGNILLEFEGEVKISNTKFEVVRNASFEKCSIMSGNNLLLYTNCPALPSGRYTVALTMNYGHDKKSLFWRKEIKL